MPGKLAVAVKIATIISAVSSTAAAVKTLTASPPSSPTRHLPKVPTFDDAEIEADEIKETRLKKGRLASIKNVGGAGGLTQTATLSRPSLVTDDSKILLGA